MFQFKEINNKEIWENFLLSCEEKTFLQSWNWGEFQEMADNRIFRFGVFDGENITATVLVSKITARRGTFLLIQHGPNIKQQEAGARRQILIFLLEELKKVARDEKTDFIRIAPLLENSEENRRIFKDLGFISSPMHANAYEATWRLDISFSEEDIMKNMRKTTRYLIRQSMKNPDIAIEKSQKLSDAEIYQSLNRQVALRQKFVPFSSEYIKNEFDLFSADDQAIWFFGKYRGELAAAALVIFWQGTGFYHQAASLSKYAKLSIPYFLQWEAIKEAKSRGCKLYDFWGFTDPQKYPKHPWAGPTLFKMGFGGYNKDYLKTQDCPISKKYLLISLFEKFRKLKRGYR
jgi:peptidoglycan pentaglycine glycine transferase (the first glycine)